MKNLLRIAAGLLLASVGLAQQQTVTTTYRGSTSGITTLQGPAIGSSGVLTLPNATDTLVGKATTDTFTNKTYDTAGTGNVFKINGTQVSAVTGTGSAVLATSPTLVTPALGVATATSINGLTITTSTGTLTIPNSASLITAGAFSATLTFTGATNVTFPTTGTLLTSAGAVTSITGTSGQITASTATGAVTLSIPSAMTGINSVTAASSTALTLAAGAGSSAVNITPSGTASVAITTANTSGGSLTITDSASIGSVVYSISSLYSNLGTGHYDGLLFGSANSTDNAGIFYFYNIGGNNSSANLCGIALQNRVAMWVTSSADIMLEGQTTDSGKGMVQLPASTSANKGIDFGGDSQIYRSASNTITVTASSGLVASAAITSGTTFTSAAPAGASAGAWKLGTLVTGLTLSANLTQAVYIDIGGTVYKLLTGT